MPVELTMPALSPTMEKGTLARWLVAEGDAIKAGDPLAEIETDKATMECEASADGRVSRLLVPEGSADVAVGTVIALIADEGDEITSPPPAFAPSVSAEVVPAPAAPVPLAETPQVAAVAVLDRSVDATPLARRIAAHNGIALGGVTGSGLQGRIVKADLGLRAPAAAVAERTLPVAVSAPAKPAVASPPEGVPVQSVKLSTMRKTIARRLTESKQTIPHFYLTARCNLDALLALRVELNAALAATGVKLSVNDLLMKAMAIALARVPDANVQFGGDDIHRFGRADIAMAVAVDGGLVTPVIRDVGSLSLSGIARETRILSGKAREGRLTPEDYVGGTATISNLGMFGIDEMVPVINPPQALILGTGAGVEQPWNVDGAVALATVMAATASFDHRAIDGATGAQFMQAFRETVESPLILIS